MRVHLLVETPLLRLAALFTLIFLLSVEAVSAQSTSRRLYLVPGAHYGTPARTSFAITAFFDERGGIVGARETYEEQGRQAQERQPA